MSAEAAADKGAPKQGSPLLVTARTLGVGLAAVLAEAGVAALAAGPLFYRMGVWSLDMATAGVGEIAQYILLAGLALSLVGLAASVATKKQRSGIASVLLATATAYGFGHIFSEAQMRGNTPPIWDAQTDWSRPVAFTEKTLSDREKAGAASIRDDAVIPASGGKWAGKTVAAASREAYDLPPPLTIKNISVAQATATAATAAERTELKVVLRDPVAGAVEATQTTPWYGLVSDVAIRITPEGDGVRIDVRSASRAPEHDMGANAALVKELIDEIALELR